MFCLGAATLPVAATTTLVSDSFSDGTRTNQNPPDSVAWYRMGASGTSDTVNSSTGYTITPAATGSSFMTLSYFTSTTMTIGSSMTLSFKLTDTITAAAASAHQGLRFGLYNSNGDANRISADSTTMTNAAFTNYTGYASFYSLQSGSDSNAFLIAQRSSSLTNSLFSTASNTTLGNAATSAATSNTANPYTITLTLNYVSATEMDITATIVSSTGAVTTLTRSSSSPLTTFDTIGIFSSGYNGSITIDNVSVQYVPEPKTVALLSCAGIPGLVFFWRRRARKGSPASL